MLIFKAPGDFSTFSKTADRAPKGGPKDAPLDPPKTHSKIDIEIQEALRRLYISCFGTPEPTRKSNSKIRGGRKGPKSRFSKNAQSSLFGPSERASLRPYDFQCFGNFRPERATPSGPRIGPLGSASGPDRRPPKQNGQMAKSAP